MSGTNDSSTSLVNQIIFDEAEAKYFLKKDRISLDLPVLNKKGAKANVDDLLGVSERLYVLLGSVGELLDEQRLKVVSKSLYKAGEAAFSCVDNGYQDFIQKRYPGFPFFSSAKSPGENTKFSLTKNTFSNGNLFQVTYRSNNNFAFRLGSNIRDMLDFPSENGTSDYKTVVDYETCLNLLKVLREKIDKNFISEGYEPTLENRSNLLSLVLGLNVTLNRNYEIARRIGSLSRKGKLSIDEPTLIKAAAEGYNDGILKVFYTNQYYPANVEELKSFKNIPYDMLDNILGGERQ